ncbi:MAG: ankyrin repeat domain-containing protein [Sideroxydans sp.]|nr:ankyrin repeat domain-containing protein [Sideroxydans sp.]
MSTELFNAVLAGDLNNTRALLQGGTDCNSCDDEGITALMLAAGLGNFPLVEALIEAGANVNATDTRGWTALMKAVYNHELGHGFPDIVSALIAAGAEIETQVAYGTRPLMLAAGYGQAEVIEVLLAAGVDVRAENEGGRTARVMAETKDYVEVINQLYQAELSLGELKGACSTGPASPINVVNFVRNPSH